MESPAIMLKGMSGSIFGVWIAHGEGRFTFQSEKVSFSSIALLFAFAICKHNKLGFLENVCYCKFIAFDFLNVTIYF